jgi:hypothetical protein
MSRIIDQAESLLAMLHAEAEGTPLPDDAVSIMSDIIETLQGVDDVTPLDEYFDFRNTEE